MFSLFLFLFILSLCASEPKLNVLLIVTDDLRPELSVYGRATHTPNFERYQPEANYAKTTISPFMLNRLAAKGIVFDLAYVIFYAVYCI